MTPRLSFKHKRPLSAIFLGSSPSSSFSANIPDLPEPPSPGGSSGSGLPSPPATNSTGSGSTGDNSTNAGSIRLRSSSSNSDTNMFNGNKATSRKRNGTSSEDEDGGEHENENDEDNTARLSGAHHRSSSRPSENELALQRVKSLTQRNRMAIDKLSRLSTPSPSLTGRSSSSRSPLPPHTANSSSSSSAAASARHSSHSKSYSSPQTRAKRSMSGSETERESHHSLRSYPSSDDLSVTPPSTISGSSQRPSSSRPRRTSAPESPDKELLASSTSSRPSARNASPGPSRTPRKRVSIASSFTGSSVDYEDEGREDVASAALAAIGTSRRSPTIGSSRRSRQPLPREFRDNARRSLDSKAFAEPMTPHRYRDRSSFLEARGSPSPKSAGSTLNLNGIQQSPRPVRASAGRSVRELSRKHQSRWLSEDLSSTGPLPDMHDGEESDLNAQISPSGLLYGKRQTIRGGSAESALGIGRSLVGEGLKAAGIGARRRESGMDLFRDDRLENEGSAVLTRARTAGSGRAATSGNLRTTEGAGPLAKTRNGLEIRTGTPSAEHRATHRMSMSSRPSTSMAYNDDNPPRTAPPTLRTYKSAHTFPERERSGPEVALSSRQQATLASNDRMYASPVLAPRQTPHTVSALSGQLTQTTTEHTRLMLESLSMFESSLSRLPPMGTTTTATIPDLFRSAQTIVHAAEKLNGLLRAGTANALERQIDADVADEDMEGSSAQLAEVWRTVGGDFRESMRVSDELVRTLTGFLLGAGKVLRESASSANAGLQHLRTGSLDEEAINRRMTPEVTTSNNRRISDGRQSVDIRRSWEAALRENAKPSSSRRDDPGSRAGSSLSRSREESIENDYADIVEHEDDLPDPSPTPASRHQHRVLPPLTIPPALSTIPSESLLSRRTSTAESSRRKISSNSNATVRAGPMPSTLKTPGATTAVTPHTVSNSPEKPVFSLPRVDSSGSSGSRANVTFSRPSTVSVSTLTGLQERARKRTISSTSSAAEEALEAAASTASHLRTPISNLDSERDSRRRTVGARGRVSLDSAVSAESPGSRGNSQNPTLPLGKKERRRTITEIFGQR